MDYCFCVTGGHEYVVSTPCGEVYCMLHSVSLLDTLLPFGCREFVWPDPGRDVGSFIEQYHLLACSVHM